MRERARARAWLLAARPRTLGASAAPVAVGLALAARDGPLDAAVAAATLACALLLQIAANFANDYFDAARGVDTAARLGPVRVVAAGMVTPAEMRVALACVLAGAAALGAFLTWKGGWPIAAVGIASLLCAVAYSAGPALAARAPGALNVLWL
jgi:1,4-dihydroxy-2-naphthoate octaprenyltransferase